MIRVHIQNVIKDKQITLNPKYIQKIEERDGGHGSTIWVYENDVIHVKETEEQLYEAILLYENVIRVHVQSIEGNKQMILNTRYIQKIGDRNGGHGSTIWMYENDTIHVKETEEQLYKEII